MTWNPEWLFAEAGCMSGSNWEWLIQYVLHRNRHVQPVQMLCPPLSPNCQGLQFLPKKPAKNQTLLVSSVYRPCTKQNVDALTYETPHYVVTFLDFF